MNKRGSRRIPEEKAATVQEIREAIEALTPGELLRLEKYARWRIRGLGRKAAGRSHEDLLGEAMTATLAGERRWNRERVDFFGHLKGAVRSISDNWNRKTGGEDTYLEAECIGPESKVEASPLRRAPSLQSDGERRLGAHQMLLRIEALFVDDPLVLSIIAQLGEGMNGPEIQGNLGISKKNFETAMKRMRRKVRRLLS